MYYFSTNLITKVQERRWAARHHTRNSRNSLLGWTRSRVTQRSDSFSLEGWARSGIHWAGQDYQGHAEGPGWQQGLLQHRWYQRHVLSCRSSAIVGFFVSSFLCPWAASCFCVKKELTKHRQFTTLQNSTAPSHPGVHHPHTPHFMGKWCLCTSAWQEGSSLW